MERGAVSVERKEIEPNAAASLKIIIALVILLRRRRRRNAAWDVKLHAALKAFSMLFAKIPLEGRTSKLKRSGNASRIWKASGLEEKSVFGGESFGNYFSETDSSLRLGLLHVCL